MKTLVTKLFPILMIIITINLNAEQVTTTTSDGDWSDGSRWNHGAPNINSTATTNHSTTINSDLVIEGDYTINAPTIDVSGGSEYKSDIQMSASLVINSNMTFEGEVKIQNSSYVNIGNSSIFTVGNLTIENFSTIDIAAGSKLIINGNLIIKNEIVLCVNGGIEVNGDVEATNFAIVQGSVSLSATGNIDIYDNASIFPNSNSCSYSVLPIGLVDFDAYLNEDKVNLKWTTETETNNDYFTIERSLNTQNWEEVVIVNGAVNSNTELSYQTIDNNPLNGTSYYRLKQTDFDGKFDYSNVVAVNFQNTKNSVSVYPNPFLNQITIKGDKVMLDELQIIDDQGREVNSFVQIEGSKEHQVVLDAGGLAAGIYTLKTSNSITRLVKE